MYKAFKVYSKVVGNEEHFFVTNTETNAVYHVTDNGIQRIAKLPEGAEENTWSSGVGSKLDNARKGNIQIFDNPADMLFAYATEKQLNGE